MVWIKKNLLDVEELTFLINTTLKINGLFTKVKSIMKTLKLDRLNINISLISH